MFFLRRGDEAKTLLKSQPQICAMGADGEQARALQELSIRRENVLLVGARGTGKTLVLKLLQQRLEAAGRKTLLVNARASHVPLAVSIALSQARENGNYATLSANAHMHSHKVRKLDEDASKQLRQSLDEAVEQLNAEEATLLIDDFDLFDDGKNWPSEFQNTVFLSTLFRHYRPNIIATTSHTLGSANAFGRISTLTPVSGQDYRTVNLAEASHQDSPAKQLIGDIITSRFPQTNDFNPDIDALVEYASTENPRRVLNFIGILERSGRFTASAVKAAHDNYMKDSIALLESLGDNIGAQEYARQIGTIVASVKKASGEQDSAMMRFGRSRQNGVSSVFHISPADDITVLGWAINLGLILLIYNHSLEKDIKFRFPTRHDEKWFIEHYDTQGMQNSGDGEDKQDSLF